MKVEIDSMLNENIHFNYKMNTANPEYVFLNIKINTYPF